MNDAELYQISNQQQQKDARYFLDEYSPKINWKNGKNAILDIGCGDGGVTNILKRYIPNDYTLVGGDISVKMVKYANNNNRDEKTFFRVLDIEKELPEGLKGSFDNVFSFYALHWIINQQQAFRNIWELLGEGGECFLMFVADSPVFEVYRILKQNNKWSSLVYTDSSCISPYHDIQNPEEPVRKIMESIGFVDIDVQCKKRAFVYENMEIAKKALKSICPFQIPANLCDDFMNDYIEAAKELGTLHTTDHGLTETLRMEYRLVVVHSRK